MFKKVVLSSLLSVTMVFSVSVPVGAEMAEDRKVICPKVCDLAQKNEDKYRKDIVNLEKKINSTKAEKCAALRDYYNCLFISYDKGRYDKKADYIDNAIKNFTLAMKDKSIECYNKEIDVIRNTIRLIIEEFYKICPNFYCEFKDEEVKNSILAKEITGTTCCPIGIAAEKPMKVNGANVVKIA